MSAKLRELMLKACLLRSKDPGRRIGPIIKKTRLVKATKLKVLLESDVNLSYIQLSSLSRTCSLPESRRRDDTADAARLGPVSPKASTKFGQRLVDGLAAEVWGHGSWQLIGARANRAHVGAVRPEYA